MLNVLPRRVPARAARGAALVLAALAIGACGGDDITDDDEPVIGAVRLTVTPPGGGVASSYTINASTASNPVIQLKLGTSSVTAQVLDGANNVITLDEPFELRIVSSVSGAGATEESSLAGVITFARNGTLSGTINASTTATVSGFVRLVHIEEAHSDFDARVSLAAAP